MRKQDVSHATLHDGLLSASMCLAARTSETSRRVEPVVMPGRAEAPRPHANGTPRVQVSFARGLRVDDGVARAR
jgi:hypothetical protein